MVSKILNQCKRKEHLPRLLDPTRVPGCRVFVVAVDRNSGDIPRALGRARHLPRGGAVLCAKRNAMLLQQFAHFRLPKRHRDSIHASFDPCSKIIGLESILGAKFAGSFSDCSLLVR